MINVSVEHTQQLESALSVALYQIDRHCMSENQVDALRQLRDHLRHALETERPHGIKGVIA